MSPTKTDKSNRFLPAYTLFDVAFSYTNGKFGVNLNAYNLANKRYAPVAGGIGSRTLCVSKAYTCPADALPTL